MSSMKDYLARTAQDEVISGTIVPAGNHVPVSLWALQEERDAAFRRYTRIYEGMRMGELIQDGLVNLHTRETGIDFDSVLAARFYDIEGRLGNACLNAAVDYVEGRPRHSCR